MRLHVLLLPLGGYAFVSQLKQRGSNPLAASPLGEDDDKLREMAEGLLGRSIPTNPFAQDSNRPGKGDLYQNEELQTILELHNDLEALRGPSQPNPEFDAASIPSLHEAVLEMMGEQPSTPAPLKEVTNTDWLDEDTKARISQVRAIASDVDGTLLTSQLTLHPRTKQAVEKAVSMAYSPLDRLQYFFPATGKSRAGALKSLRGDIAQLLSQTPGVFLQGLYCVDAAGECVFSRKLNTLAVEAAEALAKEVGVSVVAYDGDQLWTTEVTDIVTELSEKYMEPMPQLLDTPISEYGPSVHKMLLMDHDLEKLQTVVRPKLEALAVEYDATVTQAMPHLIEWLPRGCSKALGVEKLCEALSIDMSTQLLALGDAENDAEMLQQASIGVAMGNANEIAREAADFVMTETNNDGGAGAAMEVFAFGHHD